MSRLRPGDIIRVPGGRRAGLAIVLQPGPHTVGGNGRPDGPGPLVLTEGRQVKRLAAADFPGPAEVIDKIRIPGWFSPRSPQHRKDLASTMRNRLAARPDGGTPVQRPRAARPTPNTALPTMRWRSCGSGSGVIRATTARTARNTPGTPNATCGWAARPRRSSTGWPAVRT